MPVFDITLKLNMLCAELKVFGSFIKITCHYGEE